MPFTGAIDPATVNSDTIYLVNLGDTLTLHGFGERVGINQVVWDPATTTLVVESDQLLQQHSRYLLVVTDGVHDAKGKKIKNDGWGDDFGLALGRDRDGADYRRDLRDGVQSVRSRPSQDRRREPVQHPERQRRPGEDPPPDQALDPGVGRLHDRLGRRWPDARGVPGRRR